MCRYRDMLKFRKIIQFLFQSFNEDSTIYIKSFTKFYRDKNQPMRIKMYLG